MDYDSYLIDGKEDSEIATDMPCGDGTQCCFPAPCIVSNKSSMSEDEITGKSVTGSFMLFYSHGCPSPMAAALA